MAFYFPVTLVIEMTMKKSNCLLYKYVSAQHLIADSGDVKILILSFTNVRAQALGKTCTYRYLSVRVFGDVIVSTGSSSR